MSYNNQDNLLIFKGFILKAENFIASHLLKAIDLWTDLGFGNYELYFLRTLEKKRS